MLINNKEKQFAGGNWSSNKWTKEHTEVKQQPELDVVPYKKPKKGKKNKKKTPYVYKGHICPFCLKELPDDTEAMKNDPVHKWRWNIFHKKVTTCPHCGAYEVTECPACKRETWYCPRNRWYKHIGWGMCGFEGKKKEL